MEIAGDRKRGARKAVPADTRCDRRQNLVQLRLFRKGQYGLPHNNVHGNRGAGDSCELLARLTQEAGEIDDGWRIRWNCAAQLSSDLRNPVERSIALLAIIRE